MIFQRSSGPRGFQGSAIRRITAESGVHYRAIRAIFRPIIARMGRKVPNVAKKLGSAERAFVEALLSNGGSKVDAYRVAFPARKGTAQQVGKWAFDLCKRVNIRKALDAGRSVETQAVAAALDRYGLTRERMADAMARLALTEAWQLADLSEDVGEDGKRRVVVTPKLPSQVDQDARQGVIGFKVRADGTLAEYLLPDKRQCMMDLCRIMGWVQDKPIETKQMVMLKIER